MDETAEQRQWPALGSVERLGRGTAGEWNGWNQWNGRGQWYGWGLGTAVVSGTAEGWNGCGVERLGCGTAGVSGTVGVSRMAGEWNGWGHWNG